MCRPRTTDALDETSAVPVLRCVCYCGTTFIQWPGVSLFFRSTCYTSIIMVGGMPFWCWPSNKRCIISMHHTPPLSVFCVLFIYFCAYNVCDLQTSTLVCINFAPDFTVLLNRCFVGGVCRRRVINSQPVRSLVAIEAP